MAESCIFCRILKGEIPGQFVYQDDHVAAFRDINPTAPTHVLVVPKEHLDSLAEAKPEQQELMGRLLLAAGEVARHAGLAGRGYRVVVNTGPESGSEVSHLHLHVLGGRRLGALG